MITQIKKISIPNKIKKINSWISLATVKIWSTWVRTKNNSFLAMRAD
jgi:hypothetical protein